MEKNKDNIILHKYIEQQGFSDARNLSKSILVILRGKEDFEEYIIKEENDNRTDNKTRLKPDAKILIDNLCLLQPYRTFFGRDTEKSGKKYPALHKLKKIKREDEKIEKYKHNLNKKYKLAEASYLNFDQFERCVLRSGKSIDIKKDSIRKMLDNNYKLAEASYLKYDQFEQCVLRSRKSIDITRDSIREMLDNNNQNYNYKDSFILSLYSEITEVESKNKKSEDDYSFLAEKYYQLDLVDDALENVDNALSINPDNIRALIIKYIIIKNIMYKHYKNIKINNTLGYEEHPLTSEEFHQKEEIESSLNYINDYRNELVDLAIRIINVWPSEKGDSNDSIRYPSINFFSYKYIFDRDHFIIGLFDLLEIKDTLDKKRVSEIHNILDSIGREFPTDLRNQSLTIFNGNINDISKRIMFLEKANIFNYSFKDNSLLDSLETYLMDKAYNVMFESNIMYISFIRLLSDKKGKDYCIDYCKKLKDKYIEDIEWKNVWNLIHNEISEIYSQLRRVNEMQLDMNFNETLDYSMKINDAEKKALKVAQDWENVISQFSIDIEIIDNKKYKNGGIKKVITAYLFICALIIISNGKVTDKEFEILIKCLDSDIINKMGNIFYHYDEIPNFIINHLYISEEILKKNEEKNREIIKIINIYKEKFEDYRFENSDYFG